MAQKVTSGHRIKLAMLDPQTGRSKVVGIFNDVTLGVGLGATPVYILGRSSPAAIQFTHSEPITFRARAWRVIDAGPYVDGGVPKLQDLLSNPTTTATLMDRQLEADGRDATIGEVTGLVITGFDQTVSIRNLVEYTVSGMGILFRDESAKNAEGPGATDLP